MSLVGELNDLGLSDIFQILALSQRTGTLVVTTPQHVGQVLFASGAIVGGGLSPYEPALGHCFVQAGVLPAAALPDLLAREMRGTQGAPLLQQLGPDPAVFLAVMEQALRTMMAQLLSAHAGSFSFESALSLDPWQHFQLAGTMAICPKGLKAQYLAMEAMRERDEAARGAGAAAAPPTGRPQQLAQALMGSDGPKEDDWSALLPDAQGPSAPAAVPAVGATPAALGAPAAAPSALARLRDVVQELQGLPHTSDPSALLLRGLRLHCERGAYFELREGTLVGRGGFGKAPSGQPVSAQVCQAELDVRRAGPLTPVLQAQGAVVVPVATPEGSHRALLHALGGAWRDDQPVLLAPWRVGGRVMGLLVGDNPSGQPLTDAPGVDILLVQGRGQAAAPPPRRA